MLAEAADRQDHSPADPQLSNNQFGDVRGCTGDDYAVKRRGCGPAAMTVPDSDTNGNPSFAAEGCFAMATEFRDDINGEYVGTESGKYGTLISGSRADLKNLFMRLRVEQFRHVGDDIWLGYGLTKADLVGIVAVVRRPSTEPFGNKLMPPDTAYSLDDSGVPDTVSPELRDHLISGILDVCIWRAVRGLSVRNPVTDILNQ